MCREVTLIPPQLRKRKKKKTLQGVGGRDPRKVGKLVISVVKMAPAINHH